MGGSARDQPGLTHGRHVGDTCPAFSFLGKGMGTQSFSNECQLPHFKHFFLLISCGKLHEIGKLAFQSFLSANLSGIKHKHNVNSIATIHVQKFIIISKQFCPEKLCSPLQPPLLRPLPLGSSLSTPQNYNAFGVGLCKPGVAEWEA